MRNDSVFLMFGSSLYELSTNFSKQVFQASTTLSARVDVELVSKGGSMQIRLPLEVPEIVMRYKENRFVVLPHLLTAQHTQELLTTTTTVPSQEVMCRDPNVRWQEQKFFTGMPVFELFRSATPFIADVLEGAVVTKLTSWSSVYSLDKYINPHTDQSGTIQLLICLEAPPEANGGNLNLHSPNVGVSLCLQPGDGLLFDARRLFHWTTPLIATDAIQDPHRTIVVGRYFTALS